VRRHGLTGLDPIEFQVQVFEIDWILVRNTGTEMRSVMCQEAGAATVELDTQLGNEAHEKFRWDCSDGGGVTQAIRVGNYANQVRLLNAAGMVLSETNVMPMKVIDTERPAISVQFDLR
jgi:hypothetical protein